jgi:hypothetical protein
MKYGCALVEFTLILEVHSNWKMELKYIIFHWKMCFHTTAALRIIGIGRNWKMIHMYWLSEC